MSAPHVQRIEVTCSNELSLSTDGRIETYEDASGGTVIICAYCGNSVPRSGDEHHEIRNIRSNEP